MKKDVHLLLLVAIVFLALLPSCKTQVPKYNYAELAKAAVRLHIDIDMNDNHRLYIESARWIGVPYRHGGNSKRGIDCSGLTSNIVKAVYNKQLERNSDLQRKRNCRKINKHQLKAGDLVFFHNGKNKKQATHVGIYLKENKFIHASTSRGVIVSNLDELYYREKWMQGGQIKGL